jgi:hypothetical protein
VSSGIPSSTSRKSGRHATRATAGGNFFRGASDRTNFDLFYLIFKYNSTNNSSVGYLAVRNI